MHFEWASMSTKKISQTGVLRNQGTVWPMVEVEPQVVPDVMSDTLYKSSHFV